MVKADLMQVIDTVKVDSNKYHIDCIAATAGHLVLRLPSYHCQLNPIGLVWSDIKWFVASTNLVYILKELKKLIAYVISQVSAQRWKNYVTHVIDEEDKMVEMDHILDKFIDNQQPVVVSLGEDTSSDEDASMNEEDFGFQG
ncbi:hypothetical protein HPB49_012358 [Dermacentor silvarum]|uniref:Uncharacterized protein n=1 Tax=Dermacentor silvarum TaxID=543639 RepID=A0ACB8C940_DERSI|nr:hypothetical protein HPB49_012358 [Dermacentor silvarum]